MGQTSEMLCRLGVTLIDSRGKRASETVFVNEWEFQGYEPNASEGELLSFSITNPQPIDFAPSAFRDTLDGIEIATAQICTKDARLFGSVPLQAKAKIKKGEGYRFAPMALRIFAQG